MFIAERAGKPEIHLVISAASALRSEMLYFQQPHDQTLWAETVAATITRLHSYTAFNNSGDSGH
jgi:hypothetical protein